MESFFLDEMSASNSGPHLEISDQELVPEHLDNIDMINLSSQLTCMELLPERKKKNNKRVRFTIPVNETSPVLHKIICKRRKSARLALKRRRDAKKMYEYVKNKFACGGDKNEDVKAGTSSDDHEMSDIVIDEGKCLSGGGELYANYSDHSQKTPKSDDDSDDANNNCSTMSAGPSIGTTIVVTSKSKSRQGSIEDDDGVRYMLTRKSKFAYLLDDGIRYMLNKTRRRRMATNVKKRKINIANRRRALYKQKRSSRCKPNKTNMRKGTQRSTDGFKHRNSKSWSRSRKLKAKRKNKTTQKSQNAKKSSKKTLQIKIKLAAKKRQTLKKKRDTQRNSFKQKCKLVKAVKGRKKRVANTKRKSSIAKNVKQVHRCKRSQRNTRISYHKYKTKYNRENKSSYRKSIKSSRATNRNNSSAFSYTNLNNSSTISWKEIYGFLRDHCSVKSSTIFKERNKWHMAKRMSMKRKKLNQMSSKKNIQQKKRTTAANKKKQAMKRKIAYQKKSAAKKPTESVTDLTREQIRRHLKRKIIPIPRRDGFDVDDLLRDNLVRCLTFDRAWQQGYRKSKCCRYQCWHDWEDWKRKNSLDFD